jgi:UDP-N-acetylmuramoyl-L-alanyl-D-glutamate--2,6-diaminopimelate ligase
VGEETRPNALDHTTPEAPAVQAMLAEMVDRGVDVAVLEVSSHALSLDRVRGCAFDVAVFTNLSPEHLNFHGSLDAYRDAKASLMRMLPAGAADGPPYAAINLDDASADAMIAASRAPVRTYGIEQRADFRATDITLSPAGSSFTAHTPAGEFTMETQLLGEFNVSNWLAAIAATSGLGVTPTDIQQAARELGAVRGRMERIDEGQPYLVVVDFAHTPQALETALRTLRPHARGRTLTLFGQAGGRDPANRPAMGRLATELSDFFLITLDDPINEDPQPASTARRCDPAGRQRPRAAHAGGRPEAPLGRRH